MPQFDIYLYYFFFIIFILYFSIFYLFLSLFILPIFWNNYNFRYLKNKVNFFKFYLFKLILLNIKELKINFEVNIIVFNKLKYYIFYFNEINLLKLKVK